MKKTVLLLALFLAAFNLLSSESKVEAIMLKEPIDFGAKLLKNNIFFKKCKSFDWEDGFFYFLDTKFGTVFKVDDKTGKLQKTIATRGQGPAQLQQATAIRVKDKKIYILDNGFGGFKIFDTEGKLLKETKLTVALKRYVSDVNDKGEIFLGRFDKKQNTLINVYDISGKKLRAIAPVPKPQKVPKNKISQYWYYHARLDHEDNLYLLFYAYRKLAKYNQKGELLWEIDIKNELLDSAPKDDGIIKNPNKTISMNSYIVDFDITPNGNIVIGHYKGGSLYSAEGKLKNIIAIDKKKSLMQLRIFGERLVRLTFWGEPVEIYKFTDK